MSKDGIFVRNLIDLDIFYLEIQKYIVCRFSHEDKDLLLKVLDSFIEKQTDVELQQKAKNLKNYIKVKSGNFTIEEFKQAKEQLEKFKEIE